MDIKVTRSEVNLEALDANLKAEFGEGFFGVSFDGQQVILHFDDAMTQSQIVGAMEMTESHDPNVLTPSQEAAKAHTERLAQLREINQNALDLADYDESASEIRRLAEKIAWLESEITAQR